MGVRMGRWTGHNSLRLTSPLLPLLVVHGVCRVRSSFIGKFQRVGCAKQLLVQYEDTLLLVTYALERGPQLHRLKLNVSAVDQAPNAFNSALGLEELRERREDLGYKQLAGIHNKYQILTST